MIKVWLLTITTALLGSMLLAHSIQVPLRQGPSPKKVPYAYIQNSCAPWGGPAVTIYLSDAPQKCEELSLPYTTISIWKGAKEISGQTFTFPDYKAGWVARQITKDSNQKVRSGRVHLQEVKEDADVKGDFDLEFEDGHREQGSFRAKWCHQPVMCG